MCNRINSKENWLDADDAQLGDGSTGFETTVNEGAALRCLLQSDVARITADSAERVWERIKQEK